MCEPTTILAIGTAVAVASTVATGVVQQQQAQQNEKTAKQAAAFDESQQRQKARQLLGAQRAAYAKAGVTLAGSPTDVIADTAAQAEIDALAIRWGGQQRAAAYRQQGSDALFSAGAGAAGALLTGATAYSTYYTPGGAAPTLGRPARATGMNVPGVY